MKPRMMLNALSLLALVVTMTACPAPTEDGVAASPPDALSPSPSEQLEADVSGGAPSLRATIDAQLPTPFVFSFYTDDTSNDQCLDLTGTAPLEIPCGDLVDVHDCGIVSLSAQEPIAVICDIDAEFWGIDIGYEGAYTTAAGERSEFGISCRVTVFDYVGECTTTIAGETDTYPPSMLDVDGYLGLALGGPPNPSESAVAAMAELGATVGLEAVLRSTVVLYGDDRDSIVAAEPDYAYIGVTALTSLDQNALIADGLRFGVRSSFVERP